ncbi:DUF4381 domain-containing protein [Vibrio intestinalis]|uniref:DUF4381 domain-containing protein n=1 Tax=Vibrio intestinalis TaxID=2933291 RepID=UPI0021A6CB1B|nr:DUF4381 domain-containing protein [Vibrio intestinalis]
MTSSTNTSLLPLEAMQLPDVPSWLPLAWGWWASAASVVCIALSLLLYLRWKKKRLAPKKAALALIQKEHPAAAIELLRQAALCYFPREQIAHLTGQEWYAFLDQQMGSQLFETNSTAWQQVLYSKQGVENADELVQHCYQWVEQSLPPKKRRK